MHHQATATKSADYSIGFTTLMQEARIERLPLRGKLPVWLTGTLLRNGPAKFEVGNQSYRHWFDGLAMLHRFSFRGGQVSYANRFLQSCASTEARHQSKISYSEFATDPCSGIFGKIRSIFVSRLTDNANVNVSKLADKYVALTETPLPVVFDPESLKVIGHLRYRDKIRGQITTAHPHFDFDRGAMFSYVTHVSRKSTYNVYSVNGDRQRRIIAAVPVSRPSYMHSFGMTQSYIILAEFPLVVNPLSLLFGDKPFIESYQWRPQRGTRFLIIDKGSGRLVNVCEGEPFFSFHHVNAVEKEDSIELDLISYADASVIDALYLDRLRSGTVMPPPTGEFRRYRLPLNRPVATSEALSAVALELPRINYRRCNTKEYQFVYGVGSRAVNNFIDSLVKTDVRRHTSQIWYEDDCYPGEPVYVAAPGTRAEDEGVVISVTLDARKQTSFLLVLDARSFEEMARAEVPHYIPFGFHGQYFDE